MGHLVHSGGAGAAPPGLTCPLGAGSIASSRQGLSVPITEGQPHLRPGHHSLDWPAWPHLLACVAGGQLAPSSPRLHFPETQTILNKAESWPRLWAQVLGGGSPLTPGAAQPCLPKEAFCDCSGPPFSSSPSILHLFLSSRVGRALSWLQPALNQGVIESTGCTVVYSVGTLGEHWVCPWQIRAYRCPAYNTIISCLEFAFSGYFSFLSNKTSK